MFRVAIYGRFSDERQNASSARDQIALCEAHAQREGWRVVDRLSDEAISGAVRARPGYQALRRLIAEGQVTLVMAEALDRLSRDQEETANLFKLCLFHEVKIFTLSEGIVSELHVGLSSTINAVYLKQLAEKTHRGLASRVEAGRSAGGKAYGYRVPLHPNGLPRTGELEIVAEEAAVVRRIMTDYAKGLSPKKIAAALNAEGIPAPHGKSQGDSKGDGTWRCNTIIGNRQRGTGILNNELYAGRRIWNRLRFVHKPGDKKRVSRLNPESEWRIDEVPHLRIVPEDLWAKVRERQARLDAARASKDKGDPHHLSGAHAAKRPTYLLSGLLRCGRCGGTMNIAASNPKRYFCANAREKGPAVCQGIPGIPQNRLESQVLDGLRHQLMQPEAVAAFIRRYQAHQQELDGARRDRLARIRTSIGQAEREIANIMTAIKAGIFTSSTKSELEALEDRLDQLRREQASAAEAAPALPPDLAEVYRDKVEALVDSLNDPATRSEAGEAIRALVDRIVVGWDEAVGGHTIEIVGELAALLTLGTNENAAAYEAAASSFKLVAGAGFEPTTFRL